MWLPHPDRNHQLLSLRFYSGYHPTASKISHIKVLLNKPLYDNEIGSWWRQAHTNAAERHDPSRFMNSTILEVDNGIKSARGSIRPVVKRERLKKKWQEKTRPKPTTFRVSLKKKEIKRDHALLRPFLIHPWQFIYYRKILTHEGLFVATLTLLVFFRMLCPKFVEFYLSVTKPILENKTTLLLKQTLSKARKMDNKINA